MRDIYSGLKLVRAISPVSEGGNTPLVSQIIDRQGYDSLMFAIATGSLADAGATFTVLLEESDASDMSGSNAVDDVDLNGTEAAASFTEADDDSTKKLGYVGSKRYTRLTITPAGNAAAALISAIAILSNAAGQPVS